ncbi:MAG: HAMP domain-containing sensor histidine kinase [Beijerinckiaceae bacterium]|nr:HAMP domain-containing sensor histidine kinase [Beijerinckiaceae bacterium]
MSDARDDIKQETPGRGTAPGLSTRVLLLTIAFVMIAEVAIYIPSIANFRNNWLRDRLSAGFTAALVLEAAPQDAIPEQLKSDLLASVGAQSIVLKTKDTRMLLAVTDMPPSASERFDLRTATPWQSIRGAFATLLADENRTLVAIGDAPRGAEFIEIALSDGPLREAMRRYSFNILVLSLIISAIVAMLAVLALHLLVLRPVRRLTSSLIAFRDNPEDPSRIIEPSGARHEMGRAEDALAQTQSALLGELREKKRLASLGLAVAKINHDLRNMLSTAQLLSDRLTHSPDPLGRSVAPKLIRTLDRAIAFCQSTLTYGRAAEPAPRLAPFRLRDAIDEAIEIVAPAGAGQLSLVNDAPGDLLVVADREQMLRVLMNLLRNALDALAAAGAQPGLDPEVRFTARRLDGRILIEVRDTGPGVPERARKTLFQPFLGSSRQGGTGLGLAIAAELVAGHGGDIRLMDAGAEGGATFVIELPDRPAQRRAIAAGEG